MTKTDYTAIGECLYTETLPNGLKIFLIPKKGFRKSFAGFAVNYGGTDRRFMLDGQMHDTPAGVAHYLEHKMFDMPDGSALTRLEANGASANAFTADSATMYHFECTSLFEENLRELLRFVSTPYFTDESVAKEQGIIGQEIRMCEDSPDFRLYINLMRALYAHSPLRDSVAGTVESIAQITPETLYTCHRAFYRPGNMVLSVVGDVEPRLLSDTARELLGDEPLSRPEVDYGEAESPEPLADCISESMEVSMPLFCAGIKTGRAPKGEAMLKERLLISMALRCLFGRSSVFYNDLYPRGLINAEFSVAGDSAAGESFVTVSGESRDPDAVLDEIRRQIARTAANGIDERFFARQKKSGFGGRIRSLGNFEGLAISMADGCFDGYQPLDAFRVLEEMTAEDCSRYIAEKLKPEHFALSVIRPKD